MRSTECHSSHALLTMLRNCYTCTRCTWVIGVTENLVFGVYVPARLQRCSRTERCCCVSVSDVQLESVQQLRVTEDGRSLKVQTDLPHLVSLGSGRLSTAVTLLPLPTGFVADFSLLMRWLQLRFDRRSTPIRLHIGRATTIRRPVCCTTA